MTKPRSYPARLAARMPRRTVRLRLTALYGALFLACGAALLTITNILARELAQPFGFRGPNTTLAVGGQDQQAWEPVTANVRLAALAQAHARAAALNDVLTESLIALGIMAVMSVAAGWLVAGRALRPLRQMSATARAISEDNFHARLAVAGPDDELKDLGDTIDALLDRLQAAFNAQRNFVASASHELRTPLTLSRTLLQMALADPQPTLASYRAVCEDALKAGEDQEQLIEALLTLARSQRGLDHRERLDLAVIVRQALGHRESAAAAAGLAVSASITAAPVAGDTRLLERLAANLIDNAIRHNILHGRIDIDLTPAGGRTALRISNTGPVIPASQISRLLQPFQRLQAGRPAGQTGLGLGLSIVEAITKAHRATLTISPAPAGGLDITITFRPAPETAEQRTAALTAT